MENYSPEKPAGNRLLHWLKNSLTARMFIIGFLSLILLIPLFMVQDLIKERSQRQKSVVSEINDKWGDQVTIYGPILKLPYKSYREKHITNSQNQVTTESIEEIKYFYFFPHQLDITSNVDPETKKRGIYQTAVYKSKTSISGSFLAPNINEEDIPSDNILWNKARFIFNISNLKGVNDQMNIEIGNSRYSFTSRYRDKSLPAKKQNLYLMESEILKKNDLPFKNPVSFKMDISVNGSSEISFVPIGKTTEAKVISNWETNSFKGNFLPYNQNKDSEGGFAAQWKILDINRPFPQSFKNTLPDLTEYAFGVDFLIPVDEYQKSERATKYGFLVIGLTFLFFLPDPKP